ncbi:GNAT family N-acetyltransferase [Halomonas sp. YLGW01]|uniref:GNAT family N-acetyltransferase n=1 Tax=Halomonas sp. YLGW01 TaxID=2773308 RepID=UPI00177F87AA|nr:GNAT family N-acetyltransferase [Halomonas sp. YLGW01]
MNVSLEAITKDNWDQVARLTVSDAQRQFVAENAYSIAESLFSEHSVARAICVGDEPVGFIMYESLAYEGTPRDYNIYRFMVDSDFQHCGIGRQGMRLTLDALLKQEGAQRITVCYVPGNAIASDFYGSLGFREVGLSSGGEMIAEIIAQSTDA